MAVVSHCAISADDLAQLQADGYDADDVAAAIAEYEALHWGIPAGALLQLQYQPPGNVLTMLGELDAVAYDTAKAGDGPDGAVYWHPFEHPRPILAVDPDSNRLHILGGGYTVEDRGIVG